MLNLEGQGLGSQGSRVQNGRSQAWSMSAPQSALRSHPSVNKTLHLELYEPEPAPSRVRLSAPILTFQGLDLNAPKTSRVSTNNLTESTLHSSGAVTHRPFTHATQASASSGVVEKLGSRAERLLVSQSDRIRMAQLKDMATQTSTRRSTPNFQTLQEEIQFRQRDKGFMDTLRGDMLNLASIQDEGQAWIQSATPRAMKTMKKQTVRLIRHIEPPINNDAMFFQRLRNAGNSSEVQTKGHSTSFDTKMIPPRHTASKVNAGLVKAVSEAELKHDQKSATYSTPSFCKIHPNCTANPCTECESTKKFFEEDIGYRIDKLSRQGSVPVFAPLERPVHTKHETEFLESPSSRGTSLPAFRVSSSKRKHRHPVTVQLNPLSHDPAMSAPPDAQYHGATPSLVSVRTNRASTSRSSVPASWQYRPSIPVRRNGSGGTGVSSMRSVPREVARGVDSLLSVVREGLHALERNPGTLQKKSLPAPKLNVPSIPATGPRVIGRGILQQQDEREIQLEVQKQLVPDETDRDDVVDISFHSDIGSLDGWG